MEFWEPWTLTIVLRPEMRTIKRFYKCRCGHAVSARKHAAAQDALEDHWRYLGCPLFFEVLANGPSVIAEQKVG